MEKIMNTDIVPSQPAAEIMASIESTIGHSIESTATNLLTTFNFFRWRFKDAAAFIHEIESQAHCYWDLFDYQQGHLLKENWHPGIKDLVIKWYDEMMKTNFPEVAPGTPATVHMWSDRRAATVTKVEFFKGRNLYGHPVPKKIFIYYNVAECIDWYSSKYEIKDELLFPGGDYTLRKNGYWYGEGCSMANGEVVVTLGNRSHHIDPGF